MNFQQLRYVRETVRRNLNITEAASALFTSQLSVSMEDELGFEIFVRRGRRFVGLPAYEWSHVIIVRPDRPYDFIERFAPRLTRKAIEQALCEQDASRET